MWSTEFLSSSKDLDTVGRRSRRGPLSHSGCLARMDETSVVEVIRRESCSMSRLASFPTIVRRIPKRDSSRSVPSRYSTMRSSTRSGRASRRFRSRGISYCSWTSVKPLAYLFPCHSERSDAQARNLSLLPTSVKLSAHDETSIAARNRRVRQNRFRKIHAAPAPSFFSSAGSISLARPVRSKHRWEKSAGAHRRRASHN